MENDIGSRRQGRGTNDARDGTAGDSTMMSGGEKINVFLRLRPMNKVELSSRSKRCIEVHEQGNGLKQEITVHSQLDGEHDFSFSQIFDEKDSERRVYNDVVAPLATKFIQGENCTLVCFGQSQSGKSTLLLGRKSSKSDKTISQSQNGSSANASISLGSSISDEKDGLIARLAYDIFDRMKGSPSTIEFSVKLSYIEIYLEMIRDLLVPSKRYLKILEDDEIDEEYDLKRSPTPKIEGLSHISCIDANDLIKLVNRANAFRLVRDEKNQTDLGRSHSILMIDITQKNIVNDETTTSTFMIADTGGNEVDGSKDKARSLLTTPHSLQLETALAGKSHSALKTVVKSLESSASTDYGISRIPKTQFLESKLTTMLAEALGGNSHCSFILAASPASLNVTHTLNTLRFGKRLLSITNYPTINVEPSPRECAIELEKSKKIQSDLLRLMKKVTEEVQNLKGKESDVPIADDIWKSLNDLCLNNKYAVEAIIKDDNNISDNVSPTDQLEIERGKIKKLKEKLADIRDAKNMAQNAVDMLQGECLFLRKESDEVLQAKKKNTIDLIEAQNDIQILTQKKLEAEHKLSTSRFREIEAVRFLRQYRNFHRQLVESMTLNRSENELSPFNVDDLVDIDQFLKDAGFIEGNEVGKLAKIDEYQPSDEALMKSTKFAEFHRNLSPAQPSLKNSPPSSRYSSSGGNSSEISSLTTNQTPSSKSSSIIQLEEARNRLNNALQNQSSPANSNEINSTIDTVSTLTIPSDFPVDFHLSTPGLSLDPNELDSKNNENQTRQTGSTNIEDLLRKANEKVSSMRPARGGSTSNPYEKKQLTPADMLVEARLEKVQKELIEMTKRFLNLQNRLNTQIDENSESSKKMIANQQLTADVTGLESGIKTKSPDLDEVILKVQELDLVNKSYSDRLKNRDQHITYLEQSLRSLQDKHWRSVNTQIENEKRLRDEIEEKTNVIESLVTKIWQEGNAEVPIQSRITVPFQGSKVEERNDVSSTNRNRAEVRDEFTAKKKDFKSQSSLPLTTVEIGEAEEDMSPYITGGKSNEYKPIRFSPKRGHEVKSAISPISAPELDGIVNNSSKSVISNPLVTPSIIDSIQREQLSVPSLVMSSSSMSDSVDLATIREQLRQLDVLTKTWKEKQPGDSPSR